MLIKYLLIMVFLMPMTSYSTVKNRNKGTTVSLFSAVKGQVLLHGKPVEGANVVRRHTFTWSGKEFTETCLTDAKGQFSFSESTGNIVMGRIFPHEPVIPQSIIVNYQGEEHDIWIFSKRNYDTLGELDGVEDHNTQNTPLLEAYRQGYIALNCELSQTEAKLQALDSYSKIYSSCDLQLPYQFALEQGQLVLEQRKEEFITAIEDYFLKDAEALSGFDEKGFEAYHATSFEKIISVRFYDADSIGTFVSTLSEDDMKLRIGGEIILQLTKPGGSTLGARAWLSNGSFFVTPETVQFQPSPSTIVFNRFNVDPEVTD